MAKQRFEYRGSKRTADEITRKASEGSRDYDGIYKPGLPTFKPKEGENCVRIMPSTWEEPDWDLIVQTHYSVGPDNARYLCLNKMKGEPCPVCEAAAAATDDEERDQLKVGKGAICWVIDRDNEKAGPMLWSIPFTKVRNEIYTRSLDKKTRTPILIDHPEEGYDIVFTRKGTGTTTAYSGVEIMRDPTPLHDNEKIQQRWIDYITENPLPECLNYYDYEHIEKMLYGKAERRRNDVADGEGEAPARSGRRRPAAVDEEPELPARSGRRPLRTEPEPEPEPEPEAEVSPRSRRRALLDEGDGSAEDTEPAPTTRRGRAAVEEEPAPASTARRALERVRPSGWASAAAAPPRRRPVADPDDEIPF